MGGEQDHTEPHAAHHPGSHRADDERRAAVDAEAEHPPPLFPRDLSALDQFPHRHAAGGVSPEKPDQDPRSAAARQAEQGPGHSLQAPPQRRADPGTHQKPCQHQKREERGNDDPRADGEATAYPSCRRLGPDQQCRAGRQNQDQQPPHFQMCRPHGFDKHPVHPFIQRVTQSGSFPACKGVDPPPLVAVRLIAAFSFHTYVCPAALFRFPVHKNRRTRPVPSQTPFERCLGPASHHSAKAGMAPTPLLRARPQPDSL